MTIRQEGTVNMLHPLRLVIIGAGPGGYTAALHAADLGFRVTLIDPRPAAGGVCLCEGCIPSKTLLHAARLSTSLLASRHLFKGETLPQLDPDQVRAYKEKVVARLQNGLAALTRQRKITYIQGKAKFLDPQTLNVHKNDGTEDKLSFDKAVLATGSLPVRLPFLPDSPRVWDSTDALALKEIPSSLLVIGGGYIGLELGTAYAALGSNVSVVEALPRLLATTDKDLAEVLLRGLKKTFTSIRTGVKVINSEEKENGIAVTLEDDKGKTTSEIFTHILVSVGRMPNTKDLGLEKTRVKILDKGFIEVNRQRRTQDENISAIGDVTGQPMLAHKASHEARIAVEAIAGKSEEYAPRAVPAVVFTNPELAWCGLTESEARAKGLNIAVSKFPWAASGRAVTLDQTDGLTKIIAEGSTGRVLGVGIVGTEAGEMITEGTLAIEAGLKAEDLAKTIHPHPTLSETLMEAAEGLFGHPTHMLKRT